MAWMTFVILLWTSTSSACLFWYGKNRPAHRRVHTTDLYKGRAKISDLLPKMRWGLWLPLIPEVVSCITAHDCIPPRQRPALSPLFSLWGKTAFSHMYHLVFIHNDTNNVPTLHVRPKLLLNALQLLPTLFPAQLVLTLPTEHVLGLQLERLAFI